jgi:putative DNA primase/helicase
MPLVAMQERMARILKNAVEQPDPNRLRLVSPDLQDYGLTLATETGRQRIEPLLEGVELVIVDNISTLAACGRENEAESWLPLQDWALSLRRRGISVLFIHHAGKGGTQRGTSRREDVLDTVIALRPPKDYDPRNGAQFEVHFEKARGLMGEAVAPFKAQLTENGWLTQTLDDAREQEVGTLSAEGLSQRDIAAELGISPATVNRILKKAKEKK